MDGKMGRNVHWTDELLAKEADDLVAWSRLPNSYQLERFCTSREYPYTRAYLHELSQKNNYIAESFLIAKNNVRANREDAVASGKLHHSVYAKTAAFYDRSSGLVEQSLTDHAKDMERAKREAVKDDMIDVLKEARDAIQAIESEE